MSDKTLETLGYKQELKRSLSVVDMIVYGLIFMVPIAPFGIFGTVMSISEGMVVLAYSIGMVGMVFTALSYWRMSEEFPISGSVYGYATHAINKAVGFISGWAILLDYILVPALLYVVAAVAMAAILPTVPFWAWVLLFVGINTVINIIGIEFTSKLNWIMLVFEVIVFIIFCVSAFLYIKNTPGIDFTLKPIFDADKFDIKIVFSAVSVCVLSFLGFDGISTLAEEAKGGNDSVGKASIWALVLVGVFFVVQTYLAACVIPWEGATTYTDIDSAFYEVAQASGGKYVMALCAIATGLSWGIADCLVAQAAVSRIIFSMARDGFLPKPLAKIHPKFKTPYIATLLIAAISLVITLGFTQGIQDLAELVNFGALSAFVILDFTVIYYFIFKKKSKQYIKHFVLPLIGAAILAIVWYNLSPKALQLGLVWTAVGAVIYLLIVKVFKKNIELEV